LILDGIYCQLPSFATTKASASSLEFELWRTKMEVDIAQLEIGGDFELDEAILLGAAFHVRLAKVGRNS
jgi:hypothetical protein